MRTVTSEKTTHPTLTFWIAIGWVGFLIVPWFGIVDGFFTFYWVRDGYPTYAEYAPAAFLVGQGEKLWLAPLVLPMIGCLFALGRSKNDPLFAKILIVAGAFGFSWLLIQGFSIGLRGWQFGWLEALFGPLGDRQFGMGYGAMLMASAYLFMFTQGIAARGAINGDVFVVSAISLVVAVVTIFVFFPIARLLIAAFVTEEGSYSISIFADKFLTTASGASNV